MDQHPLSAAFPSMEPEELEALTKDIAEHGQHEVIILYQGKVLDGWHRYQACIAAGRTPETANLPVGEDPVAFVLSHNLHRRHLSQGQAALAVVTCNSWRKVGRPQNNPAIVAELTTKELAKQAGTGTRTIERAKTVAETDLADKVRDGELSIQKAAEIAKLPEPERAAAIETGVIPKPEPAPTPEPAPVETVTIPKEEFEEMREMIETSLAEEKALETIMDGDDKLAEAVAVIKRQTAQIETLQTRINGLMNEKNEAIKRVKSLQRQVDKLEKEKKDNPFR